MKKAFLICITLIVSYYLNAQVTVTVNTGAKKQTIRGMGAEDDQEGGSNDDLLYDIGASCVRYFAGPVRGDYWDEPVNDNADPDNLDLTKFTDVTGVILQSIQKAVQRNCLIYVTIGSPPAWMKTNNSGVNGGNLRTDFLTSKFEEFGEFALGVNKKFKQQLGIDLYAISVQNEPEFSAAYFSCIYTAQTHLDAAKAIITRYKANGINTKIFYGEQCFPQNHVVSWAALANNDTMLTKYINALAVHVYSSDPMGGGQGMPYEWTAFYNEANRVLPVKEVWMSEGGTIGLGLDDALGAAYEFYKAFKYGNATLFANRYLRRTSAPANYFGVKNMVRYIRPGAYRLETACSDTASILPLAFKHDATGAYTLYMVNRSASDTTINVGWTGASGKFEVFRTSFTENCEWKGQVELANTITLPASSITTLVSCPANNIPNIDAVDTIVIIKGAGSKIINLTGINNGGEAGQPIVLKAWSREGGANLFSSILLNYTSPNTTGTLTLTPISGLIGNTKIMVALNDKSQAMDSMFNEKVIGIPVYIIPYINKAPTMNDVDDQNYAKSLINTTQLITLTNVTDGNDGKQKLTLTSTCSAPWIATVATQGTTLVKITPKAEGTVTITLTLTDDGVNAGGGAGSITKSFTVVIGSGINAIEEPKNELLIYPNPASDILQIDNVNPLSTIAVSNVYGNILMQFAAADKTVMIDVSRLPGGIYFVKTGNDKKTEIVKFIKE